ncbi:lipopolysaccharide transport periplasmic protein LptA [Geoalkalibacter halelectricus]|uniref:lipopolysaccharide transport periplasmic protein LptA n=1 Tax=Geoalkalibacter halelectricus TaxID=2847045 RepID=UPI003D215E0E
MNRITSRMLGFVLVFVLALAAVADAAQERPIEVTSERMEMLSAPRRVLFSGEVVARQDDVVIYADRMQVFFREGEDSVARILAEGRVRIVQGERTAIGDSGVFHRDQSIVVLTGNPRVYQGKDFVEGEEITVYLEEERSVVTSREGVPARAIFHPREEAP